ncbi:MAG: hypothetical protein EOO88_21735 [Pedobacter sp.]|nr:MAG: hypothetical protein EOO88_21735 [Pedobacter sp.]
MDNLEVDSIWNEETRLAIETGFSNLVKRYDVAEHHNTLLYICLVESNHADIQLQGIHENYKNILRLKELAQLLLLYKPTNRHKPSSIKIASLTEAIKVTDSQLISWIGSLIQEAIGDGHFNPTELGEGLFSFSNGVGKNLTDHDILNWSMIEKTADQKIRRPGVRERNKQLSTFLLKVWQFLDNETTLTTCEGVRFTDDQLNFLFELAELLEWLREDKIESDPKDYIYTLLWNRLKP